MRNTALFRRMCWAIVLPCFSLLFSSCVDKNGEGDLNPQVPEANPVNPNYNDDEVETPPSNTEGQFPSFGELKAFPSAQGYGRYAVGGRDGEVYHVTNLNDEGKGSFRDAVSKSYRVIVFDVSGIIKLGTEPIVLKNNQTILGHTAPGDGVVLYGGRVSASGASNTIVRYLRIRMGAGYSKQADACGIANGSNIIFDHCSITWGKDENFSVNSDGKGTAPQNITIQNSILGQGLQNHSCGGLLQTGITEGVTVFRNLYIDNKTRNPKVKGLNQFVNNVLYNWGNGAAYNMGGDSEGPSETTIENNYFITGPGGNWMDDGSGAIVFSYVTPTKPFVGGNELFRTYCVGNYYDNDKDGMLNGNRVDLTTDCSGTPTFLETRSTLHPIISDQTTAEEAYSWVVQNVGATLPARDQVDAYLIDELTSLGKKGTIIRNETNTTQFPLGGPGNFKSGSKPLDTDNDGMPDEFEDKWKLNKNDATDALKRASNGYTNLENYAFSLEYPEAYK